MQGEKFVFSHGSPGAISSIDPNPESLALNKLKNKITTTVLIHNASVRESCHGAKPGVKEKTEGICYHIFKTAWHVSLLQANSHCFQWKQQKMEPKPQERLLQWGC